ncbi:hypothetical protein ACQ4PT_067732 [Festuca glaucescens]
MAAAPVTVVPRLKLGSQGMEVSGAGPRLHGHVRLLRPAQARARHGRAHPPRRRRRRHPARLLRHLRAAHQRDPARQGGVREKVDLATKFGLSFADGKREIRGDPAYVRAACEGSLKRLGVDCIDLYYQHRIDTRVPIEVTVSIILFQPQNLEKNGQIFEHVNAMATRKGCTPSQLALAWVHHQGSDVCPIPGTTKIENFNQNVGALSVKLTPAEMAELESYASAGDVQGDRYAGVASTWKDSETPPLSSWKAE